MPTVTAQGKTFTCDRGANLRQELLKRKPALEEMTWIVVGDFAHPV